MKERIVLITGGSTGLGYTAASRLKKMGYHVYITSRQAAKAAAAAKELAVSYVALDVTDEASIEHAAETIKKQEGRIDILINNAGIPGGYGQPAEIDAAIMRNVYDTNVFGLVSVTHAFLPLLEQSEFPVIVNVSSGLGSFGQVLNPDKIESKVNALAYSSSKAAVSMLTVQYAKSLPNMKINAVDPGPTKTGENFSNGMQTVEQGSDAIVKLATIDEKGPTGGFFNRDGVIPW
ncbi:SDR family NAD(P)-dependent oxidoreductase [Enterococcus devriesei]|uniref:SDR family NAD(P)-dependent oxidoreductase n=1 Tax=Enterococcus devriesei TaxID=319970 RepID=UPI001C108AEF|nr:SDR family NAD(P)-dependent oxidoreductase [Enterococcus devriesei]MBU5364429.1 SDR family NAD(P)-dependent oxidoreductase [Enterococcus devriesei]